ncbi:hypothetical protein OIV83_001445 [Microbotryomycetes sp. JL201]|nr:hypothetical protein OIV83_001445 [Microbotryomycetes sp. JL201]
MAARGGRGGGRGGRGGGRGGSNMPVGHLLYSDIIAQTKEMKDELYPRVETVQTEWPTDREAVIAARYNSNIQDLKLTPFFIDGASNEAHSNIERWEDRFKKQGSSSVGGYPSLAALHADRQWDKALHPAASFEALLEKKKRRKLAQGRVPGSRKLRLDDVTQEGGLDGEEEEEDSQGEEDPELLDDDEAEEDGNDYEMDYFDNGEEDDFDALGAGGGGGGDDDGGIF